MNTIDTRDLQDRLNELTALRDALLEANDARTEATVEDTDAAQEALDAAQTSFGPDEQKEVAELESLETEIGIGLQHGVTLIPTSDFEDYARDAAWPLTCIDWAQAAKELASDYTIITYRGNGYYYRA
jgi:multidrug efflux pump subunit AcrA (membrane-fusion protein)